MSEAGAEGVDRLTRHWRWVVMVAWLAIAGWMLIDRWGAIGRFALGDTDDNLRMMQVRALIEGQGWYDLRQYRLNPPVGADVHWSRLVDLPIVAIKLALAPFFGGRTAETAAVAIAPMLPMLVAMGALALTVKRLVHPRAFWVALALVACAGSIRGMWSPLRIDHHGWQLALLAVALAALSDPKRARGGVLLGIATALSLAIGLEMLLYFALSGGIIVLRWMVDPTQARRLLSYGVALGGGCALAFLLFASEANRTPVCDALSPVWLSAMIAAGGIAAALALASPEKLGMRIALAVLAGLVLIAAFALSWPDCLGRLERTPPELDRLWLDKVREAMPVWRHGAQTVALIVTLPLAGLIGYGLMLWKSRREPARLIGWVACFLPAALAAALLLWQTRAGPAAQLLSIPGASALAWVAMLWLRSSRSILVRVVGVVAAFLVVSGLATYYATTLFPAEVSPYRRKVNIANGRCPTLAALAPVAGQPKGTVLTFVDLGPRLIAVTPHDALAGPYHRNSEQILDVMRTWRRDAAHARRIVQKYRVDYVLICPNLSESTVYASEAPKGFYAQLLKGQVPLWLQPIPLPKNSPYRMWRVVSGS